MNDVLRRELGILGLIPSSFAIRSPDWNADSKRRKVTLSMEHTDASKKSLNDAGKRQGTCRVPALLLTLARASAGYLHHC